MGAPEEKPLNAEKEIKKKSLKEKWTYIKENITVEPVLACHIIPAMLAKIATQNLNLDKACRVNMAYGDQICDSLIAKKGDMYFKEELAIQELIAVFESWRNILLTAIPSFLIIFIGAWSDRTGKRKICILMPLVGELLTCLSNLVNAYFFYELPVEVAMFFDAFFPAVTGGWVTTYMGAFAYISDITSEKSRTYRIGIANLCLTVGGPIGSALSGILLHKIGYYGVYSLCSLLYMFSILYGCFGMKDPERIVTEKPTKKESSGVWSFVKSFFDIKHVKDTVQVTFKNGPNGRRIKSILILTCVVFVYGPNYGENAVKYLFTRYCFNWDAVMYSFYTTFFICTHSLGALISITWFSHRLNWDDSILGLISAFSKIIGCVGTALAGTTRDMFIAIGMEMFNANSYTALRSFSSKLCTSDELGKMTSFFNLVEVATSMVFGPIYSMLYGYTIKIEPRIMFYVSTILTIPVVVIFGWFYIQHKKDFRKCRRNNVEGNIIMEREIENQKKEDQLVISNDEDHEKVFVN